MGPRVQTNGMVANNVAAPRSSTPTGSNVVGREGTRWAGRYFRPSTTQCGKWQVDEKSKPPTDVDTGDSHQSAADQRTDQGRQTATDPVRTQGLRPVRSGEQILNDSQHLCADDARSHPLQKSCRDDLGRPSGQPTDQTHQPEGSDTAEEQRPPAVHVAQPAGRNQRQPEGQ